MMTYAELDLHSNRIANELRRVGLPLEHPVIMFRNLSCEYIAGIMGVLKAGGCYLPVALDTPKVRLEFLLKDSGSRFVLTDATGAEHFREWPGLTLELARIISNSSTEADKDVRVPSDPHRRVYITYTSGSTGQPKGVEIEQHSWANFISHYHRQFGLSNQDRSSLLAYPPFDISVADIWPTLCAGGCLVVPPQGILLDPDSLIAWLASEEVTLTFVPTGVAEILFTRPWPKQMKLRWFTTGGDRLRIRPPGGLPFPVLNCYGPTENTIVSTFSVVAPQDDQTQLPTIGRPLGNVRAYVLDEDLRPVPVGVEGHLYLGGEQVARGYLNRPELTAEKFLPDPFVDTPGGRMYQTGDWVRWLPDGELDFLGRHDDQVQIRGTRVELGEIDAALCAYEGVRQGCCVPVLDNGMSARIAAHIVPIDNHPGFLDGLKAYLRDRLPPKSVPSEYVIHERLPLTSQGKLDRQALRPAPAAQPAKKSAERSPEEALRDLWCSLLPEASAAEPEATFQCLGGDSLTGVKLMLGVEEITGQKIELSTLMVRLTFAGLCEEIKKRKSEKKFEPVIALRQEGGRTPLFCVYGLWGDINFHGDFANAMGGDQPIWGVRCPGVPNPELWPVSIEAAAEEVRRRIREVLPKGVPALIGYSWGGLLAFEVARQFAETEGIECFTAMLGSDAPPLRMSVASKSWRFAAYLPQWAWGFIVDRENRRRRLSRWREMLRSSKKAFSDDSAPVPDSAPLPDWAKPPIARHFLNLARKYHPRVRRPMQIDYFREGDPSADHSIMPSHPLTVLDQTQLPDGGWRRWCKLPPRVHWVEGDHESILRRPHLVGLAKAVRAAMDQHAGINAQL